jgi:hypothetical protein
MPTVHERYAVSILSASQWRRIMQYIHLDQHRSPIDVGAHFVGFLLRV